MTSPRSTRALRSRRLSAAGALVVAVTLAVAGCSSNKLASTSPSGSGTPAGGAGKSVVIGSAGFTEINVMAAMYSLLLQKAGYTTSTKVVQNREIYEPALESGQIDVVPDYAATMAEFLNTKKNGQSAKPVATPDKDTTVAALRTLATPLGLTVLDASNALDSNAFAVTKSYATAHHLTTLSDLGSSGLTVNLAATEECPTRPFCELALKDQYKIKVGKLDPLGFDTVQVKQAVKSGKDQLGLVGTTDGTLADFDLVILTDDKKVQLADNLVPIVGKKFANDPTLAAALNKLASVLTTDDLAALNKQVDVERMKPEDAASAYLKSKGLI